MQKGGLVLPRVGWEVILLFGLEATSDELSYVNSIIPSPLNACVGTDTISDDILFQKRRLYHAGEVGSRYLTSSECREFIHDSYDVSLLSAFSCCLSTQHDWNTQLRLEREEDGDSALPSTFRNMNGIPQSIDKEVAFIKMMDQCASEIHHAVQFHSDLIMHLHSRCMELNRYIHLPLIPRNETTIE